MNRIEIDVITGERKVIELTAEEVAQAQAQYAEWLAENAQTIAVKESALAKLAALGLTQDEVKVLVGNLV